MGSITSYFDVAQVTLYLFWIFFAGLLLYLIRENKREGYPLETDHPRRRPIVGFPVPPDAKTFLLPHGGGTKTVPVAEKETRPLLAKPLAPFPGAPLMPTGNPMLDGIGPGGWTERADKPDLTADGHDRIVPLRTAALFHLDKRDPDPRGMQVVGADGYVGGKVTDVWVDRSEYLIRYLEVEVAGTAAEGSAARTVLVPVNFTKINARRRLVDVHAILSTQFKDVPALKNPSQVTRREEERVCAYFGAGTLYATPARAEPLI